MRPATRFKPDVWCPEHFLLAGQQSTTNVIYEIINEPGGDIAAEIAWADQVVGWIQRQHCSAQLGNASTSKWCGAPPKVRGASA